MNKKFSSFLITLTILAMTVSPLIATVMAKNPAVTDEDGYIQYVGTLGGANYVIRIPDEWNGMLVVGCHGYMGLAWTPDAQFAVDGLVNTEGIGLPFKLLEQGFAYASSSYGEGGFSVKMGMIRTHQLTEYVIDNFGLTGKVFIIGNSMGGTIGLTLGEKYPELYDGVVDSCGMKDVIMGYTDVVAFINGPIFPTLPPVVQLKFTQMKTDMEAEYGGTYDEKPKAYERTNPVSDVKISIPMISVQGALDPLTSPQQAASYGIAVAEAGCLEYYRFYLVADGAHGDAPVMDEVLIRLWELVNYPVGW